MLPPSKLTKIFSKLMVGSDEGSFSNGPLFRRHLTHLKFNSSPLKIYLRIFQLFFRRRNSLIFLGHNLSNKNLHVETPNLWCFHASKFASPSVFHTWSGAKRTCYIPLFLAQLFSMILRSCIRLSGIDIAQRNRPVLFSEVVLFKDNQPV